MVINAGSEEGVKLNQEYEILDEVGETIYDPDTNKSLGTLYDSKGKVIITQVYDHIAVAQSEPVSLNIKEKLNIDKTQLTGYAKNDLINLIKIGDVVKLCK